MKFQVQLGVLQRRTKGAFPELPMQMLADQVGLKNCFISKKNIQSSEKKIIAEKTFSS